MFAVINNYSSMKEQDKIRQQSLLRDKGIIEFLGKGKFMKKLNNGERMSESAVKNPYYACLPGIK